MMQPIDIVLLNENCMPHVGSDEAAGMDLRMNVRTAAGYTMLEPNQVWEFGTGVKVKIPTGWVGLIMPRSGLGFKYEVKLANTVGVIDSDYLGEIKVKVRNCGDKVMDIADFERICQMVIVPHYKVKNNLNVVDSLEHYNTERGEGGFGHSGRE